MRFNPFQAVSRVLPMFFDKDGNGTREGSRQPAKRNGDSAMATATAFDWESEMDQQTTDEKDGRQATETQIRNEVLDPETGELIDANDIDGLAGLLGRLRAKRDELYAPIATVERFLASHAPADDGPRTKRVRGKERTVKIEHPGPSWNNSMLKEAWNSYPKYRDEYLRLERVAPKVREVKKLQETTAVEKDFETFQNMVLDAEQEPTGKPRITVEK